MTTKEQFEQEPRDYALAMVEEGYDALQMLMCALRYMSHDDVRDMLDKNELSPRFTMRQVILEYLEGGK
jgi:hypothetical protein